MKLILNTDGGSRGNPGPGAIGVVITDNSENTVYEIGKSIGHCTNNEAEYQALVEGLTQAKALKVKELECKLDSELVVKQLTGSYKVKNARIKVFWQQVKELEKHFTKVTYIHIPREKNKEADKLVNEVLDAELA